MPLGTYWRGRPLLFSLESLRDGLCGSAEKTCTLDPAVKRTWSDDSWITSTPLARTRPSGPRKYLGVSQKIRDRPRNQGEGGAISSRSVWCQSDIVLAKPLSSSVLREHRMHSGSFYYRRSEYNRPDARGADCWNFSKGEISGVC